MAASTASIDEFLSGPLVKWLSTCVKKPESLQVYENFLDGTPINEVLLQIDPEPSYQLPGEGNCQNLSHIIARIKIFHCIIRNIKSIYEDELGQVMVASPDCVTIGKAPVSEAALEQLKLLILLLLGCAVQGPTKETFILKIKQLDVDDQHEIVECIKKVTDDQNVVLTSDWTEQSPERLYSHVVKLISERDRLVQQWVSDLSQEGAASAAQEAAATAAAANGVDSNHLAVELADWKAKLRKLRQELEEKTEILTEMKDELEHANCVVSKLKAENSDLVVEARRAKVYRDEMDSMREKLERIERLETEVQRYRERLTDAEFYKVRVDELREDNRVLMETREMLEAQLSRARYRADHALQLEAELLATKQTINDIALERDAARERIQELLSENIQLQQVTKSALQESNGNVQTDLDESADESNRNNNSLSEQLTNSAQARALRLELENKKLLSIIDSLKEDNIHENSNRILELEKEKKKLQLKCDQLQENRTRLTEQTQELENLFKNAIHENSKLQETLDMQKAMHDRQTAELQNEKLKINDLENNMELLTKEKQRLQVLCDTIKNRADMAEKSLLQVTDQLESLHTQAEKAKELEKLNSEARDKLTALEKEVATMQKEASKLKEMLVAKDATLDQQAETCSKQEKEIQRLLLENENVRAQLDKFQEYEQKSQELVSQASVNSETIANLQKDLVNEKVRNEKFKTSLEKLGLTTEILDETLEVIIAKMMENAEVLTNVLSITNQRTGDEQSECKKCAEATKELINAEIEKHCEKLSAEIANLQAMNASLQNENVTLTVSVSTLQSQINSLQTQQTALQLANSQLVAEKDELLKKQQIQNTQHDTLLLDQMTLRSLHEQLSTEYEQAKNEQENLKKISRDLRSEIRGMKEKNNSLQSRIANLEIEKEAMKNEAKNLAHLKGEHMKLKDDFRNLFTASDRMKQEYKAVQEELKNLKIESRNLRLGQTEMQGELNSRSDRMAGLQLENAKLQQKCDMLFEMNHSLDSDRRALMDHVSQLLSQYHSLLTHSLEDKQHYHIEEKLYTDKLNNLCRQKEKLEEKIMEHYRKLDNASSKKKGFGATLVRRVRKAGSDIINKVPSRNRRSWHEDGASQLSHPPPLAVPQQERPRRRQFTRHQTQTTLLLLQDV
ncbi:unnamed protein product [Callosobruchus maculatus]|uniref:HOOK N-terminal domain-containing protein n=1 Tax=Callosobruchus maculatus TaxID=64391 RepID=A0A653C589_CALMS|nr:unnamed protein product [Callosobruchus maculatus]